MMYYVRCTYLRSYIMPTLTVMNSGITHQGFHWCGGTGDGAIDYHLVLFLNV